MSAVVVESCERKTPPLDHEVALSSTHPATPMVTPSRLSRLDKLLQFLIVVAAHLQSSLLTAAITTPRAA
jgi:hypothetical protein